MHDVIIVGGGITGTAVARNLSRYKLNIALLEKESDISTGSTKANSAIVHGGYAENHSKLKGWLCYQGRRQYAQLERELHFGFQPIGSMVLAFEEEQREALVSMLENGRENGLPDLTLLNGDAARTMEPNINPDVKYALWCSGAGICSPFGMAIALMENAVSNGVSLFLNNTVSGIAKRDNAFTIHTKEGGVFRTRYIVNAAGLYAANIAALAGAGGFSIHARSGEYIVMNESTGSLVNNVLFQMPTKMGKGILVTPTVYGNLMIGPDAIDERRGERDTTLERLYSIYNQALLTTEKLDIRRFLRSFAGLRAVSDTDDFIIGRSDVPGFINAAGIQSPGLTSAPAIADLVRGALYEDGLDLNEKPDFNPERNAPPATTERLAPAELKPLLDLPEGAEGRMLCRCKQVSEAAVRNALSRGLPVQTVDAVKRRTLAGMGWCQGEFCRPRTASFLSHYYHAEIDSSTDAQRDGLTRVGRTEILEYFKKRKVSSSTKNCT